MCVSETRGALPGGARSWLESPGAPSITKEPLISHHDHFADTRPTRVHHPLPNADRFALVIYSFEYQGARFNGSQVLLAPTVVLLGMMPHGVFVPGQPMYFMAPVQFGGGPQFIHDDSDGDDDDGLSDDNDDGGDSLRDFIDDSDDVLSAGGL